MISLQYQQQQKTRGEKVIKFVVIYIILDRRRNIIYIFQRVFFDLVKFFEGATLSKIVCNLRGIRYK